MFGEPDPDLVAMAERVEQIRAVVAILAPFGGPTAEDRAKNTLRALSLARLAMRKGFAPVVVHDDIFLGVLGSDDNPDERTAGITAHCKVLSVIRDTGGGVWGLTKDDGMLSDGTAQEMKWFCGDGSTGYIPNVMVLTWLEWLGAGAKEVSDEAIAALARVEGLVA